ncbi:MAG: AAA family ATPase, partial [Atribacterota bacterium]|nr:AAA family ATPase [Atribacterota bacterium]
HCLNEIQSLNKKIESYNIKMQWNSERDILLKKQKNEMIQFIQNYQQEESNRQGKIQKLKLEEADLISKESEMIDVYNKLENILNKINSDKIKILAKIKEHDTSLKDLRIDIENTQNKIEKIKNYYYEAEMGRVQNEEKIKYLLETIKNQFNSTVDEVLSYKDETNTQKEASENIAYYKEKISSMGQINFDAIQEFQKHQSRYNELNDKKIDIVKSKEKLIDLIKKIDWIAEDHFLKTFQMVEIYFKDIFQKLFDGGQANLELTNTKRILDAGIEVMVQPPGKKLQNISLLSTGEKSLTAIALLFALWKVNPSPFCFFDEIDSALDETNVLRLANFLKNEDLKEAQIIIITHQRGIMESADAIYGITMEGSGISKLMSVKILDSEE